MVSRLPTEQKSLLTCSHGIPPITGRHSSLMHVIRWSTYFSNRGRSASVSALLARASSQDATKGRQPSSVSET